MKYPGCSPNMSGFWPAKAFMCMLFALRLALEFFFDTVSWWNLVIVAKSSLYSSTRRNCDSVFYSCEYTHVPPHNFPPPAKYVHLTKTAGVRLLKGPVPYLVNVSRGVWHETTCRQSYIRRRRKKMGSTARNRALRGMYFHVCRGRGNPYSKLRCTI